jgi:hypothetical protein
MEKAECFPGSCSDTDNLKEEILLIMDTCYSPWRHTPHDSSYTTSALTACLAFVPPPITEAEQPLLKKLCCVGSSICSRDIIYTRAAGPSVRI